MAVVELKVPEIGESITEVTLSSWLKSNGEYVDLDEPICEFESDKATLEFPSEVAGKLIHIANEGDDLEIGALVAKIDDSVSKSEQNSSMPTQEEKPKPIEPLAEPLKVQSSNSSSEIEKTVIEMKVPVIGESITEVTLSSWLVGNGEYVKMDQPICEFESDKATLEFPSEATGQLTHIAKEGQDLEIGALVAKITVVAITEPSELQIKKGQESGDPEITALPKQSYYAKGHPSPAAAKILSEKNIPPHTLTGSGKGGRIRKEDAVKAKPVTKQIENVVSTNISENNGFEPFSRNTRREKMSRMRRTIASRLISAKNDSAMLTTFNEVDLTNIIVLRKKYQEKFVERFGVKLGFMSLFSKACSNVLIEMPQVNAIIDGNELIYHDFVDISVAISTPTGLVVPPVRNVESLNFHEIELKVMELAEKARSGKLSLEEMTGGTFSITNGGIFGSMMSTPILNKPQSAILGMHTIKQRPIAVDGEVAIRPMMYLALSYDHRVIDGSSSVTFLVKVIELLEDPMRLMMGI